jgi:hypothetical protein
MAVALVANAALLHAVDTWLALDNGIVSILTLACYTAFLAHVPAPLIARAFAIMALGVAFVLRDYVLTNWRWLLWFDSLIFAINFKLGDAKAVPTMPAVPLPLLIVARYLVQLMLERTNGVLEEHCTALNTLAAFFLAIGAVRPFHHPLSCYWWGYLGSAAAGAFSAIRCAARCVHCALCLLAVLTDQPWCFLLGTGYACSLLQGVGHEICSERANLPELATRSGVERAADEIAHVTYFPVLVMHSAYQSVAGYRAH